MTMDAVVTFNDGPFPKVKIPWWELQDRFNDGRYWQRALEGSFLCRVNPVPKKNIATSQEEPAGTVAFTADFYELNGDFVFRVHIHLRPDGSLGGREANAGKEPRPDPKALVENGVKYCYREGTPQEIQRFRKQVAMGKRRRH